MLRLLLWMQTPETLPMSGPALTSTTPPTMSGFFTMQLGSNLKESCQRPDILGFHAQGTARNQDRL